MSHPDRVLTEVHLNAVYDLALRSEKPHFEMLAAYAALHCTASELQQSSIIDARNDATYRTRTFQFGVHRKGPLENRLLYTISSYKEIEVTRAPLVAGWLVEQTRSSN